MNEHQLIQKIAAGSETALEELHRLYYERVARFLYRLTADKEHIIEIVNDTFFTVWKNAATFRNDSAVSTWIFGIAYNKGLQSMSRRKPLVSITEEEENSIEAEDSEQSSLSERNNMQLLGLLSPHHRVVMELTYYFGYSYKEIAEIVGCPENTVKTRMFHGRQHLRALMQDHCYVKTN